MSASSKNLGQIAGVHIGTTPPTNTLLIWYDNTPSQLIHKVYNPSTKLWGALDPEIVTNITYSELTTLAKNTGLTIGKYFQLTDASNVLAIAITTTKVQYTDSKGNILIDDLGSNIQYHVSSSNLQIDDLSGVFDETNKKLVFQFDEYVPVISTDYLFGKVKRGTTWILAKFKFNSLLSTVTNNSLSWNSGLFFSFSAAIKNVLNKKGGVVGYDEYTTNNTKLNTSINSVGKNNENIIANADKALTDATTPSEIYAKAIPSAPATGDAPGDVLKGDTLLLIINKFQRWVNKFKYATGIRLSSTFATFATKTPVNNNDTVESAISKLKKYADLHENSDNISVSSGTFPPAMTDYSPIMSTDNVKTALAKLEHFVNNISGEQLNNGIIDFLKIDKAGVLPTDLFRIDLTTSFDFSGGGIGGVVIQGYDENYFTNDDSYPYSPYRITNYYNSYFPKILSFVPVIPVIPNDTNFYSNAGGLVHYIDGDASVQAIFQIPKSTYQSLYNAGNRYFKCIISADVYNHLTQEKTVYISLNYVNYVNVNLLKSALTAGVEQHIVFKMSVSPTVNNS